MRLLQVRHPICCVLIHGLAWVVALGTAQAVWAASPSLSNISPQGGQRGTEVEVKFTGGQLTDAQEIMFCEPGIKVTSLEAKGNVVTTKLAIAADCRLGIFGARVRTASGISNLRTFHVGALPVVQEVEPNSEFDTPQKIAIDSTVRGVVQTEDVDYYLVEAKKGERISAEIVGLRLGRTFFDPYVSIMDMGRFELATSDDAALLYQDAVASIVAPADGSYVIQVRESAYQGNGNCTYRLHVGRFPRPTAVLPAGGKPGETLDVRWLGDPAGERVEKITVPTEPADDFRLFAKDQFGVAPSGNVFRISDLTNFLEAEPNNDHATASACQVPGALNGVIAEPGDVDMFKFKGTKGQRYDIRVHARRLRSPLDPVLEIWRAGGGRLAANDDSGGPDSYLRFTVPDDKELIVLVRDHLGAGGANYVYRVEVTPIAPRLTMGIPEIQRYVATTVAVPRGNRHAVMVSASRADFGGDVNVSVTGMPAGMTFQAVPMAANQTTVPVLFTAPADAQPAGAYADLVGKPADEKIQAVGHLKQTNLLVRGQGNRNVWSYYGDRMPLVLTEQVPFKIEIVQPKVPLVRSGSMQLKVVATRAEGFTAPIPVRMLYNPSGVSSSSSVQIPEGKNEALIPLTANGGAALATWKIAVIGRANINGQIAVSSQLADLEVAEPFVGLTFQKSATEQGQEAELLIDVENKRAFDGAAKVELVGLPAGTATPGPLEMTKDTKQLVFKITAAKDARVGRHKTLLCRALITMNGEPVMHTIGTGELQVDKPLPPKVAPPAKPAVAAKPQPKPMAVAQQAKPKPLSRLERLRLERKQAKAGE